MTKLLQEYPIIGLAGPATAGKSTIAEMLHRNIYHSKVLSFAQPIRDMLKAGLGVQGKDCPGAIMTGKTFRELMQSLGTEWGRNTLSENVWINCLDIRRRSVTHLTIIDDVRFENEAAYIRRKCGVVIHVRGRGGIDSDHSSEDGINKILGDIELDNSGTIDKLKSKLDALCGDEDVQSV